tara:strand:- start:102 stop:413 length:312 start_codon:yes stop_codon:yes gene_type:complete
LSSGSCQTTSNRSALSDELEIVFVFRGRTGLRQQLLASFGKSSVTYRRYIFSIEFSPVFRALHPSWEDLSKIISTEHSVCAQAVTASGNFLLSNMEGTKSRGE